MSGYSHLTAEERDRIAGLKADGLSLRSIAKALGRAVSTISRELRRNALDSGAYRPHVADGAYMLRRQRKATIETDAKLAAYVTDRLTELLADCPAIICRATGRPSRSPDGCGSGSSPACAPFARRRSTAGSTAPARRRNGSGAS